MYNSISGFLCNKAIMAITPGVSEHTEDKLRKLLAKKLPFLFLWTEEKGITNKSGS